MKVVICPQCSVHSEVPDEAKAFRCRNCDAFVENIDSRAKVRKQESANNSALAKVFVIGIGVVLLMWVFGDTCYTL